MGFIELFQMFVNGKQFIGQTAFQKLLNLVYLT